MITQELYDIHDPYQARAWEKDTVRKRPMRPMFFAKMVEALKARFTMPIEVLELGSGSGHLAEAILKGCAVTRYGALDFSEAMHQLARARL